MALFVPDGFTFLRNLNSGFYGPSYLIKNETTSDQYICKCFLKSSIGNSDDIDEFLRIIKQSKKIRERCFQPFRKYYENEQYIIGIRPFFEGLNLMSYISSVNVPINLTFALWKVLVRLYRHLGKHQITPIFIKPSNIFVENGMIKFVTDIYPPPRQFNPTIHRPNPFDVGFLAPEFFFADKIPDVAADIWALGVMLWFMTMKKLPWNTNNAIVMLKQIQKCQLEGFSELPDYVREAIGKMLVLDPKERIPLEVITHSTMESPATTQSQIIEEKIEMPEVKKKLSIQTSTSLSSTSTIMRDSSMKPILQAARREIISPAFLHSKMNRASGTVMRRFNLGSSTIQRNTASAKFSKPDGFDPKSEGEITSTQIGSGPIVTKRSNPQKPSGPTFLDEKQNNK